MKEASPYDSQGGGEVDLKNHWSDHGTGGALRRGGPLMAGPALSRKERGWEESLVTALSAASGGLAVRMMGLLPALPLNSAESGSEELWEV